MEELWKWLCSSREPMITWGALLSHTRWNESDERICSSQHKILKLVILDINWYTLSPRNIETFTSSRQIDATIFKLRTLHKQFLTRFGGRDKNRTNKIPTPAGTSHPPPWSHTRAWSRPPDLSHSNKWERGQRAGSQYKVTALAKEKTYQMYGLRLLRFL